MDTVAVSPKAQHVVKRCVVEVARFDGSELYADVAGR